MEYSHDNTSMLTLFLLFYAWAMVKSVGILLALMIKEPLRRASHEICHNSSEFYNYYLVYYLPIILQWYMHLIIHKVRCVLMKEKLER